ncbi:MAG: SRPBCC family protein [Actinomycetota bacterium]|nr:SRPBCC family protein [Actinomycetota bacterium]
MASIERSIDVKVPVRVAYNQWTQFEEFPQFMEGVKEVRQLDDTTLHWSARIGGQERQWKARVTEQHPDLRIAWAAEGDTNNAGVVTFHRLDDATTRVMLQLEYEPSDIAEKAAEVLGIVERRVKGDLERFKKFIEARGQETGAWRGTVEQDRIR